MARPSIVNFIVQVAHQLEFVISGEITADVTYISTENVADWMLFKGFRQELIKAWDGKKPHTKNSALITFYSSVKCNTWGQSIPFPRR